MTLNTHKNAYARLAFLTGNMAYFREIPESILVIVSFNVNGGRVPRLLWGSHDVEDTTRPLAS
jgi:hypothetical protein